MSARDLAIKVREEMRRLPAREQVRFLGMLTSMSPTATPKPKTEKTVVWEDRTERLKEIFGGKMLEKNLIFELREEEH